MSTKRDQLVEAALSLFCREGYHATGIDRILEEAGVAKMTLYKHFRSKQELILAALRLRDQRWRHNFMRAIETRAADPAARLLAIFDELGDWFASPGFNGCMFINASAEYAEPDHPIHAAAAEHKRLLVNDIRGLAQQAGAADPQALAAQLVLLIDGAIVLAQVCGGCDAAGQAQAAARVLIHHQQTAAPPVEQAAPAR